MLRTHKSVLTGIGCAALVAFGCGGDSQFAPPDIVAMISVAPTAATITAGQTSQLTAAPRDANHNILAGRSIAWNTSNPAVATVDGDGTVAAITEGSATITASAEGRSATAAITVLPPAVANVSVTPTSASIQVGGTTQLAATARDADGNVLAGRSIAWTSTNTAVATVNSSGLVTGTGSGSATIRATSEGVSGTATVTVASQPPTVANVVITPASASVQAGGTVQLSASARDANGNTLSGYNFAWTSSNTGVATVGSNGVVSGAAAGTTTITATTSGVSGTANVTVTASTPPAVASVVVTPSSASVQAGSTIQLTASARDGNGNTLSGHSFTWTSSNTSVATVNSSGIVTGESAGTATVTAATSGVSGTSSVTVTSPATGNVLFFSDWRTARGNSMQAVTDGGKWDFVSAEYDQTMDIVATTGLDFPTTNAYRVIATASRSGWSELRHTSLPLPAVGQSRFYRWYMRITMPDGLQDDQTHPIQDNYLENWGFIVYNGGGGGGVPNGMWRPEFWSLNSGWPNDRWRGPNLAKNQTYRVEMQIERTGSSTYRMHVRIYDSAGTLVVDDGDVRDNANSGLLSTNPTLALGNVNALNGITAGNNGIGDNPTFPFTVSYQSAFAVCANTWCGAYNGSY